MKRMALILAIAAGCSMNTNAVKYYVGMKDTNNDGKIDTRVTLYTQPRKTILEKDTNFDGMLDLMVSAEVIKEKNGSILEEIVLIDKKYDDCTDYEAVLKYDEKQNLREYNFGVFEQCKNRRNANEDEINEILYIINELVN